MSSGKCPARFLLEAVGYHAADAGVDAAEELVAAALDGEFYGAESNALDALELPLSLQVQALVLTVAHLSIAFQFHGFY